MKSLFLVLMAAVLMGCASAGDQSQSNYDPTYKLSEVAVLSEGHFGLEKDAITQALRPTFKKYGRPRLFISGQMSSVDEPMAEWLYGQGLVRKKIGLPEHTFWRIEGQGLQGKFKPMKAAHLVYNRQDLKRLDTPLQAIGDLNRRGQTFTVFERAQEDLIIVTINKTEDLPETSKFNDIKFFEN